MIRDGFVKLIQAGLGTPPMASGGFNVMLPKDYLSADNLMAWTYRSISSEPEYILEGQDGFTTWEIQLDCHGFSGPAPTKQGAANAITLAQAIDSIVRGGWSGILPDADHTHVYGIFRSGPYLDGYSDANRSNVVTLEYKIQYAQI
jgi:hypothetical protein